METLKKRQGPDWTLIGTLVILFFGYVLLFDITGRGLLANNDYDSYTLQALAWLDGRAWLDPGYDWLELAIYDGRYYVSFPPFPSVVMLPFVLAFGHSAPSNLVLIAACLLSVAFCYQCFRRQGTKDAWAAFWAVFYVMGSNMLSMSVFGGVWYMAQGLNMALATGAIWALMCERRALCMTLLALAIGCRPFSICLFAAAFVYFAVRIARDGRPRPILRILSILIIPALIGLSYAAYNYARFGDPLEFGHSYLPEFTESEKGQFDLSYIGQNAYNIFCIPVLMNPDATLEYPVFDGFMFFIANPFFIVWFAALIRDCVKRGFSRTNALITAALAANLFMLLLHKTFGGWQFGARYTVDLLPYALWYLMEDGVRKPREPVVFLGIAAVMFNAYGALTLFFA